MNTNFFVACEIVKGCDWCVHFTSVRGKGCEILSDAELSEVARILSEIFSISHYNNRVFELK